MTTPTFDVDYAIENLLGRKEFHDPANLNYPIRPRSLVDVNIPTKKIHWPDRRPSRLHLHQDCSGCTGWALCTCLNHLPFHRVNTVTYDNEDSRDAYVRATENDPWPWTYDPATGEGDEGSSGGGAAKGARDAGWISGWNWGLSEALFWAGMRMGPMYVGTVWYRGMMLPNSDGNLEATGNDVGGHQYCIDEYDPKLDRFKIDQTWGRGWGENGFAHIRRPVLFDLIFNQNGDAIQLLK